MNLDAFKEWVTNYTTPITQALLWIIPIVAVIAALITIASWFGKDEHEREQQSWVKPVKKIVIAALVGESILVIFKIFGL